MGKTNAAKYRGMRAEAERQRVKFIEAELESGLTFAGLAQTEYFIKDMAAAMQAVANAKTAHQAVLKYLAKAQLSKQERQSIGEKLKQLELALEQLPQVAT
jgi:hypothetical protein